MKLPVIKIVKESCQHAWEHRFEWFKVGFAPLLILGVLYFAMYMLHPESSYTTIINEGLQKSATEPNVSIQFWVFMFLMWLSYISLSINGYRYAILHEGADRWVTFNLNMRFVKQLIYSVLLIAVLAVSSIILGGMFFFIMYYLRLASVGMIGGIIGSIFFILFAYFYGRLAFTFLLISLDKIKPIRSSWQLSKGNVLRILAILFSILVPACFFNFVLQYGIAWLFKVSHLENVMVALIPGTLIHIFVSFIYWAVSAKTYALAYQALTKAKVSSLA